MNVNSQDASKIKEFLEQEMQAGNLYVAYHPAFESMQQNDLNFFSKSYDA